MTRGRIRKSPGRSTTSHATRWRIEGERWAVKAVRVSGKPRATTGVIALSFLSTHFAGPAPTQRPIQLHRGRQLPQLRLTQPELGVEEAALCLEHLDVAGDAGAVANLGQLECPPKRLSLSLLRHHLVARAPDTGKRVARFAKRDQDTLLVLQPGLLGPGAGGASLVHQPAAGEEWERHPCQRLIDLTVPVEQVADLSHLGGVIAGDGYGRQTR